MIVVPMKRITRFVRDGWVVFDNRKLDLSFYCENSDSENVVFEYLAGRWARIISDDRVGKDFTNRPFVLAIRPLSPDQAPEVVECWELSEQRLYGPLAATAYVIGSETGGPRKNDSKVNGTVRNSGFIARKNRQNRERKDRD